MKGPSMSKELTIGRVTFGPGSPSVKGPARGATITRPKKLFKVVLQKPSIRTRKVDPLNTRVILVLAIDMYDAATRVIQNDAARGMATEVLAVHEVTEDFIILAP